MEKSQFLVCGSGKVSYGQKNFFGKRPYIKLNWCQVSIYDDSYKLRNNAKLFPFSEIFGCWKIPLEFSKKNNGKMHVLLFEVLFWIGMGYEDDNYTKALLWTYFMIPETMVPFYTLFTLFFRLMLAKIQKIESKFTPL